MDTDTDCPITWTEDSNHVLALEVAQLAGYLAAGGTLDASSSKFEMLRAVAGRLLSLNKGEGDQPRALTPGTTPPSIPAA